jgi:hypothetical protein
VSAAGEQGSSRRSVDWPASVRPGDARATLVPEGNSGAKIKRGVTPDFPKKTKCISYVRQDQVYTHMIDVMSDINKQQ